MTTIEVPATVYAAMRALLDRANVPHTIGAGRLEMPALALTSRGDRGDNIVVTSLLSSRTHAGRVELQLNTEVTQMDLDKAREVVGMLQGAIEASVSDQLLFEFLTGRVGLAPDAAAAALLDFRELRQGSRDVVNPS